MSYNYYLGPWVWQSSPLAYWMPPLGTVGCVDLASLPQLAGAPGSPRSLGFFATTSVLPSEYTLLGNGDCRSLLTTAAMVSAWKAATGFAPSGQYLVDLLYDQLTSGSDPTGQNACLPLVPTADGWLEVHLGGHSPVKSERFEWGKPGSRGTNHTPKLKALLQADFRRYWTANQDQAQRVMDFWCDKYRLQGPTDWHEVVPKDLLPHVPGRLPHSTTLSENFNTADSTTLGPTYTWTEYTNGTVADTWSIVSNAAQCTNGTASNGNSARAEADLSSSDNNAAATITSIGSSGNQQAGTCCRFDSASATAYLVRELGINSTFSLDKMSDGSITNLGSVSQAPATGVTVQVEANGSTITSYYNGTLKSTQTDTTISSGLRGGIFGYSAGGNAALDNWTASDVGGGGGGILYTQLERDVKGMARGIWGGSL